MDYEQIAAIKQVRIGERKRDVVYFKNGMSEEVPDGRKVFQEWLSSVKHFSECIEYVDTILLHQPICVKCLGRIATTKKNNKYLCKECENG